ncbi:MAG: PH domain-containing protein, partial [Actinomycetota bacterium]
VPSTDQQADPDLDWHRPHAITLLLELGTALRSMALAIIVVGGNFLETGFAVEAAVVLAPMAAAVGRWYTTRYALGPESIHYRYGLLRRRKQVMPRANVQNVSTRSGLFARFASVTELHISDASATGDIKLRLVSMEEADRLTTLLRTDRTDVLGPAAPGDPHDGDELDRQWGAFSPVETPMTEPGPLGPTDAAPAPGGEPAWRPPDVAPPLGRLVQAELTSMPAAVGLAMAGLVPLLLSILWWRLDLDLAAVDGARPILLGIPAVIVVMVVVSVAQRIAVLGGFQLRAEPDRLRIQAGLLTEARIAARRERIQQLEVQRDLLHRRFGIERVKYETADVELQGSAATVYLHPAASADEWRQLTTLAIGGTGLGEHDLRPVSPRTRRRTVVRAVPLIVAATVAADTAVVVTVVAVT